MEQGEQKSFGIHWFRRDLRIHGNPGLIEQFKRHQGRVIGFFCFDKKFLNRSDFSANRFQFFLQSLIQLQKEMRKAGSDLICFDSDPLEAFPRLIKLMKDKGRPSLITWCRDYEPFARKRDQKLADYFFEQGIETSTFRDHLIIEPTELLKDDGTAYKVYTPFSRKWNNLLSAPNINNRIQIQKKSVEHLEFLANGGEKKLFQLHYSDLIGESENHDLLAHYAAENKKSITIQIPLSGTKQAFQLLRDFKQRANQYQEQRDFPALNATSRLSLFLKNGSITTSQIAAFFDLHPYEKKNSSLDVFFSELIWREFYYHILYWFPQVEQKAFVEKYTDLNWENNETYFEAWKDGLTGFPIVDAGMRQLKTTGWMHNRVRMIVASFLTKDLLVDWKWGELYFMQELLDGDLAPNNGGWQWAASTGCDAQPYFRIFNPWTQGKKFDPEGVYIKTYLPELENLPPKELHRPIIGHSSYPSPIIDHAVQREKALTLFKAQA